MALLLRQQGIINIRPLQGGFGGWKDRGYPLQNAADQTVSLL